MKKFFLIFLFSLFFISPVFAENIILRPTLTPMIYENSYKNNFFINTTQEEKTNTKAENNNFSNHSTCVKNPEIQVFMYHYIRHAWVGEPAVLQELSVPPEIFEKHLEVAYNAKKLGKIALLTGDEFIRAIEKNCFPHKKIWIFTADDGWEDNFYALAPIAEKYQIPFIFGITSGFIGKQNFVTHKQIKELSKNPLFTIASHSVTHAKLNYGALHKAKAEFCESKKTLEKIIEKPVKIFIYPYGIMGKNSVRFAKECGYSLAWSTHFGEFLNWKKPNFFNMNRIHISPNTKPEFFEKLAQ